MTNFGDRTWDERPGLGWLGAAVFVAVLGGACGNGGGDQPAGGTGTLSGHVFVSGPLAGAAVSIDQLDS